MFFETPLPFGDLLGFICILIFSLVAVRFYFRVTKNEVNALDFFVIGFSAFQLLDITRYQFAGDSTRILDVETQVFVVVLIFAALALVLFAYRFAPLLPREPKPPRAFAPPNLPFIMQVIAPLVIAVMPIHLATYEAQEKSGYLSLIGHSLKAAILFVFVLYLITRKRILLWIALIGIMVSLTDTSRRAMVVVFFPIVVLYVDYMAATRPESLRRFVLPIGIAFLGLFVFLNYMRADHDYGFGYIEGARVQNTISYMVSLRSIDTFFNTGFILDNFPESFGYFWGSTYFSLFASPVPREFWPDKPYGLGAQLGYMQLFFSRDFDFERWVNAGLFSLSPGFVGEAYANLGVLGVVLVSLLTGVTLRHFDERIAVRREGFARFVWADRYPYVVFLPAFLLLGRGDFYSALIYSAYLFLILKILMRFLEAFRGKGDPLLVSAIRPQVRQ